MAAPVNVDNSISSSTRTSAIVSLTIVTRSLVVSVMLRASVLTDAAM
jgi:hypothetical protein